MIEVIEPGTKNVIKCNVCGCKFSYESEDIKHEVHGDAITITEKHYVICPQCHTYCTIRQTR